MGGQENLDVLGGESQNSDEGLGKMSVGERLERFFEIASLKCSRCGELGHHIDESENIKLIRTPEYFGINNLEDWEKEIDKEFEWVLSNSRDVLAVLPELRTMWNESCKAVEFAIKKNENRKKI